MSKIEVLAKLLLEEIQLMETTCENLICQNKELLDALKKYRKCAETNECEGKIKSIKCYFKSDV